MRQARDQGRTSAGALWRCGAAIVLTLALGMSAATAATTAADDQATPGTTAKAPAKMPRSITIEVDPKTSADSTDDESSTAAKGHHGTRTHIQFGDRDIDSFADAVETKPWVVGLVFLVVGSIFLTPLILLVGIIWYKLRKTRMQNDALLKLAERGVLPPTQVADAMASGIPPTLPTAPAAPDSAFPQAVAARRRAVWSDLRKGVIMIAVGIAFVFYSMTDSGSANWLGLVLMFVGIAYVALWWLEDRHLQPRETPPGPDGGTR